MQITNIIMHYIYIFVHLPTILVGNCFGPLRVWRALVINKKFGNFKRNLHWKEKEQIHKFETLGFFLSFVIMVALEKEIFNP